MRLRQNINKLVMMSLLLLQGEHILLFKIIGVHQRVAQEQVLQHIPSQTTIMMFSAIRASAISCGCLLSSKQYIHFIPPSLASVTIVAACHSKHNSWCWKLIQLAHQFPGNILQLYRAIGLFQTGRGKFHILHKFCTSLPRCSKQCMDQLLLLVEISKNVGSICQGKVLTLAIYQKPQYTNSFKLHMWHCRPFYSSNSRVNHTHSEKHFLVSS